MNVPDLLEQMTWAINEGGKVHAPVFQFLSNIARVINHAGPSAVVLPKSPTGIYAPDLLPLMQQLAWAVGDPVRPADVVTFLKTMAYYLANSPPNLASGTYQKPTFAPMPEALQYLVPAEKIPPLLQVAYWLINEGATGNQKAWEFLKAVGGRMNARPLIEVSGPYQFPIK